MKNVSRIFFVALFAISSFSFLSCEKDEGKLPNIAFKTGAGYTSADETVAKGGMVKVGITASKSEGRDVLKKFSVTKSVNGGASTEVQVKDLTGDEGDNFSADIDITAGNVAGTEKYTFTVVNRDGISNQVSLTLNVQ